MTFFVTSVQHKSCWPWPSSVLSEAHPIDPLTSPEYLTKIMETNSSLMGFSSSPPVTWQGDILSEWSFDWEKPLEMWDFSIARCDYPRLNTWKVHGSRENPQVAFVDRVDHGIGPKGRIGGGHHDVLRHGAKPGLLKPWTMESSLIYPSKNVFDGGFPWFFVCLPVWVNLYIPWYPREYPIHHGFLLWLFDVIFNGIPFWWDATNIMGLPWRSGRRPLNGNQGCSSSDKLHEQFANWKNHHFEWVNQLYINGLV